MILIRSKKKQQKQSQKHTKTVFWLFIFWTDFFGVAFWLDKLLVEQVG
jgi:hypothetical protein